MGSLGGLPIEVVMKLCEFMTHVEITRLGMTCGVLLEHILPRSAAAWEGAAGRSAKRRRVDGEVPVSATSERIWKEVCARYGVRQWNKTRTRGRNKPWRDCLVENLCVEDYAAPAVILDLNFARLSGTRLPAALCEACFKAAQRLKKKKGGKRARHAEDDLFPSFRRRHGAIDHSLLVRAATASANNGS